VWYQDLEFRLGVYTCELLDSTQDPLESPVFTLQLTFAALQEGTQSVFNPVKLVETLKLRTSEQQDAQELVIMTFFPDK
jgi:ubiquitin carboxyl-terminal hydrolase 48